MRSYNYKVERSDKTGQFRGLCTMYPSLVFVADTAEAALRGITQMVRNIEESHYYGLVPSCLLMADLPDIPQDPTKQWLYTDGYDNDFASDLGDDSEFYASGDTAHIIDFNLDE